MRRLGVASAAAVCVASGLVADIVRHVIFRAQDGDRTETVRQALAGGVARNTLFFVGDGMGDSEITAARNYAVGASGRLAMDTLPLTGDYTTYAVQKIDPTLPDYVTDSAASGTAWATGHKTSNGRISTIARTDQDLKTILEIAQERGMRTVRIAAMGPQAANVVGISDQTDLFRTVLRAMPREVPSR